LSNFRIQPVRKAIAWPGLVPAGPSGMKGRLRSIREAARKPEPRRLKGNVAKG
jgi:hypothetical protein